MSEVLKNTGVKLWAESDYSELWLDVFDQIAGQGGESNLRLIDEAIGKINESINGYSLEYSSEENRLYISKNDVKLPVSLIDDNGNVASKVDGSTITIDKNGIVTIPIDSALSSTSTNPVQNKVVKSAIDKIDTAMASKAESNHTHTKSQITDFPTSMPASDVYDWAKASSKPSYTKSEVGLGNVDNTADASKNVKSTKKIQTYKQGSTTETYGDEYPIYAQWRDSSHVRMKCDNNTVETDYATSAGSAKSADSATSVPWSGVTGKPSSYTPSSHTHDDRYYTESEMDTKLAGKVDLSKDGVNEAINKLSTGYDTPSGADYYICQYAGGGTIKTTYHRKPVSALWEYIKGKADSVYAKVSHTHTKSQITDFPTSMAANGGNSNTVNGHTVNSDVPANAKFTDTNTWRPQPDWNATSGDAVIKNKPTIPSVGNGTITITQNGTTKGTFTMNQSGNTTIALTDNNTTYGTATTSKAGLVKPDGKTITVDKDGTIHGASTYALPKATTTVLGGVKPDGKTTFVDSNGVLSAKGGGATITPKPTVNPQIKNDDGKVIITWEDPTNTVIGGSTFSTWAGTKLVMKESGYPTSPTDGTLLVDNTTRDKYKATGFTKSGLTNDKVYYFALFPYSTDGVYNYDSGNRLLGEPTELKIVTFANGTDVEIAKMIQAHYANKINISDYWAVGDTRSVALSAMSATGVGESHRVQTVQYVIGDFDHDDLATAINGHTKAAVTLFQKDCLMDATSASNSNNGSANTEKGYMNSTNTNNGGWKSCARRTWCNNVYFAALPTAWQNMVKTVNKKSGTGNGSSSGTEVTADKIFLAAEIEVFGSTSYSVTGEGTQYQYYKNATANRYKMPKWDSSSVSHVWWERSPRSGSSGSFCNVDNNGSAYISSASFTYGVAPCLCI